MTEQFWWGVVAGLAFMGICCALEKQAYRSVLLNIARNGWAAFRATRTASPQATKAAADAGDA